MNPFNGKSLYHPTGKLTVIDLVLPPLLTIVLFAFYAAQQRPISFNNGLAWDAQAYHAISQQFANEADPVKGIAPFIYRVGTPFLVAVFSPENLPSGYRVINLGFVFLTAIVFFHFLLRLFDSRPLAYALLFAILANPFGGLRFSLFYPVHVDPGAIFFSLLALMLFISTDREKWHNTLLTGLVCSLGMLFREIVLLVPLAMIGASLSVAAYEKKPPSLSQLLKICLPLIMSLAILWLLRSQLQVLPSDYSLLSTAYHFLSFNLGQPMRYITAVLLAMGPLIILFPLLFRHLHFRTREMVVIFYLMGILGLSMIGGSHIDRFVAWGAFSGLAISGIVILRFWQGTPSHLHRIFVIAPVVAAQFAAHRVFAPIPDVHNMAAVQDENVAFVLFAPYGENLSAFHTYAVSTTDEVRLQLLIQYAGLALFTWLAHYYFSALARRSH